MSVYGIEALLLLVGKPETCLKFELLLNNPTAEGFNAVQESIASSHHFGAPVRVSNLEYHFCSQYGRSFNLFHVFNDKDFHFVCHNQPLRTASLAISDCMDPELPNEILFFGGAELSVATREIELNYHYKGLGWIKAANDIMCRLIPAGFRLSQDESSSLYGQVAAEVSRRAKLGASDSEYRRLAHCIARGEESPEVAPPATTTANHTFITTNRGPAEWVHWPVTTGGGTVEQAAHAARAWDRLAGRARNALQEAAEAAPRLVPTDLNMPTWEEPRTDDEADDDQMPF